MGKMQPRWIADDGEEFDSERDMILHELSVIDDQEINLFLELEMKCPAKKLKEYSRVVSEWQRYCRQQEYKPQEEDNPHIDPL